MWPGNLICFSHHFWRTFQCWIYQASSVCELLLMGSLCPYGCHSWWPWSWPQTSVSSQGGMRPDGLRFWLAFLAVLTALLLSTLALRVFIHLAEQPLCLRVSWQNLQEKLSHMHQHWSPDLHRSRTVYMPWFSANMSSSSVCTEPASGLSPHHLARDRSQGPNGSFPSLFIHYCTNRGQYFNCPTTKQEGYKGRQNHTQWAFSCILWSLCI